MIPLTQTKFGGTEGNCFATCLASIMHLELSSVPNFCAKESWWQDVNKWLYEKHRLIMMSFDVSDEVVRSSFERNMPRQFAEAYTILTGPAPRGFRHCCVGQGMLIVHDPHPSRDGLLRVESVNMLFAASPWLAANHDARAARINPLARPWSYPI